MDPEVALTEAATALAAGDLDAAQEHLGAYRLWRSRDGFQPIDGDRREQRLRLQLAELLAEDTAKYRGYRVPELRRLFGRVADPRDWRGPVQVEIPAGPGKALLVRKIVAAVAYFTATRATVREVRDDAGRLRHYELTAPGYRAGPAGDH